MKVRFAVVLLMVGTGLWVGLPSAQASGSLVHVHCGQTVIADTKLANDLLDCPGDGLVIGADGVTLDLNGHTIDGTEEPYDECQPDCKYSTGILSLHHDGVRVENGTISEFSSAVVAAFGENISARRLNMVDQRHLGFDIYQSSHLELTDNRITNTRFVGIAAGESHNLVMTGNTVIDSGDDKAGNAIWMVQSDGIDIERNVIVNGSWAVQITESSHALVADNKISTARAGVALDSADLSVVRDNHLTHAGVALIVFGDDNRVVGNHVVGGVPNPDGEDYGVSLEGGQRNLISSNDIRDVRRDGVRVGAFDLGNPVLDNVITNNRVRGAAVDGFSVATEVTDGTVARTLLSGNRSWGAGDDGFDVRSADATLTKNLAIRNDGHGIDAVPGVHDGGGNRARRNATEPQCINVRCY